MRLITHDSRLSCSRPAAAVARSLVQRNQLMLITVVLFLYACPLVNSLNWETSGKGTVGGKGWMEERKEKKSTDMRYEAVYTHELSATSYSSRVDRE